MKRHAKLIPLILLASMLCSVGTEAATVVNQNVDVSATVADSILLEVALYRNLPEDGGPDFASGEQATMNFGELEEVTTVKDGQTYNEMRSSDRTGIGSYVVVFNVNTHRRPYAIYQNGSPLSNGQRTIPQGACTVVPLYAQEDNAGANLNNQDALGDPQPWNKLNLIYNSSSGTSATIQSVYSISGLDPAANGEEAVPLDQPGGAYTGNITFTMITA